MKLKQGISVEVLRKEGDNPYGSWHSATIIAIEGNESIIRYNFLLNNRGRLVEERVAKKNIRPQPPHECEIEKRWAVGEIVEVYDVHGWRVGKVAKVLRNKHLIIKFFGSLQLKEFHASSLRTCQVWRKNKWSAFIKGIQAVSNRRSNASKQYYRLVHRKQQQAIWEEVNSSYRLKDGHKNLKREEHDPVVLHVHRPKLKKNHTDYTKDSLGTDLVLERIQKKRTSKAELDGYKTVPLSTNHSLCRQICISNSKPEKEANGVVSNECSIASCSLYETADSTMRISIHKSQENCSHCSHSSDAESSFPALSSKRNRVPFYQEKIEVGMDLIHNLELRAYKSTVQALYASGPLSWERESLLTNLRLSLHISNDEHLLQLRHLLSAQVL